MESLGDGGTHTMSGKCYGGAIDDYLKVNITFKSVLASYR